MLDTLKHPEFAAAHHLLKRALAVIKANEPERVTLRKHADVQESCTSRRRTAKGTVPSSAWSKSIAHLAYQRQRQVAGLDGLTGAAYLAARKAAASNPAFVRAVALGRHPAAGRTLAEFIDAERRTSTLYKATGSTTWDGIVTDLAKSRAEIEGISFVAAAARVRSASPDIREARAHETAKSRHRLFFSDLEGLGLLPDGYTDPATSADLVLSVLGF